MKIILKKNIQNQGKAKSLDREDQEKKSAIKEQRAHIGETGQMMTVSKSASKIIDRDVKCQLVFAISITGEEGKNKTKK